jgi:hypothetical protein
LIVEMYVGGMSQRDIEYSLESALGQFVLSKSTVSELTTPLSEEYEAWRVRDLSTEPVASLFMDTVYEPFVTSLLYSPLHARRHYGARRNNHTSAPGTPTNAARKASLAIFIMPDDMIPTSFSLKVGSTHRSTINPVCWNAWR